VKFLTPWYQRAEPALCPGMLNLPTRRITLSALAILALVPAGASAKPHAQASQVEDRTSAAAANEISKEAWAAGEKLYGEKVTADLALSAYWTPERMRAAQDVDSAEFLERAYKEYEVVDAERQRQAQLDEEKGIKPPEPGPELLVKPDLDGEKPAARSAAFNPNLGINHPTARTNGKVFFNLSGGSFSCSASVINSEGKDTVWTAGHCVNAGSGSGAWATNWTFVPAYDDDLANPRPHGTWSARQLWTKTAWKNNSDFAEDMGVAIMNTRNGNHIVSQFGGHGLRANFGKYVFENAMGYPAEAPFDGGNLMRCWGSSSPEWSFLFWSSDTIKIPCDMTRGSSGGPWLHGYDGNYGYLNGVNSRIDRIVGPTIMLSPYFDNSAVSLYNATRFL
jgi:V8-like Glu-specific endopeptidase